MRKWLAILLLAAGVADAQEGFPLDGTWRGEREAAGESPATIVLIMQWDGQKISGVINPGPKAIPFDDAKLIPEGWRVSLSAKTPAGQPISLDGVIGELGAYNRTITGTWKEGGRSYRLRLVRD